MRNREKTRPRLRQLPAAGAFLRKTALDGARRGRYAKNRACGASCCGGLERMEQNGKTDHCNYRGRGTPRTALQYLCAGKSHRRSRSSAWPTRTPSAAEKRRICTGLERICALKAPRRWRSALKAGRCRHQRHHGYPACKNRRSRCCAGATTCFWKSPSPSMRTRCGSCSASSARPAAG